VRRKVNICIGDILEKHCLLKYVPVWGKNIIARSSDMKKSVFTIALTVAVFLATVSTAFAIPPSVQEARRNAQAQNLVTGVGEARHQNATVSRNAATISARAGIARELEVIVSTVQRLHMTAFEINHCSVTQTFFDDVTTSIAESRLQGSTVIHEHREPDGRHWVVMALSRENAVAEISRAATAAETTVAPAVRLSPLDLGRLSAMDAIRRMDEALELYFRGR